jgi:hypothetical protein
VSWPSSNLPSPEMPIGQLLFVMASSLALASRRVQIAG